MNKQVARHLFSLLVAVAVAGSLGGCATSSNNPSNAYNAKDPFQGFNRALFAVNEGIDVVVKPVAKGYDAVAPLPVKVGIGNFFGNVSDAWIAVNNLLQGKVGDAASDTGRFLVNTTVGIGGVFDVASDMGLKKHSEDFGQTLGWWGVGDGPYFFWPLIGPRTTRDTLGWLVDNHIDPVWRVKDVALRNSLAGVRFVDLRAGLLPTDKVVEEAAFDKYNYIRDAYLQNRRNEIFDGNPPRQKVDED
jgi:phospholipid-binding lipoprotein MlaA